MDKVIATILLIIAAVVGVGLVVGATLPAINRSTGAMLSGAGKVDERIKTQVSIAHATRHPTENTKALIWVKNVGASRITAIENSDIYFGQQGNFSRITYDATGASSPSWKYDVEGGGEWTPDGKTVKFTINYGSALSGTYFFKVVTPNGVSAEDYFSM